MMAGSDGWRALNLELEHTPKLLVKSHFTKTGYRIELTDLSRIWEESLSKHEVIHRALECGSSIDPGQDDEQLEIFYGKIRSALDREDGTFLSLSNGTADGSGIFVNLSIQLPHPLPPLKWSIHLQLLEPEHVGSELLTPLISQASRLQHQIGQLISELQDKDRVISKICDRLETSGNDLTAVFPGVSNIKTSRKKGQREQLAKHVKGLADFDESVWRKRNEEHATNNALGNEYADRVLQDLPSAPGVQNLGFGGEWWQHLDETRMSQPVKNTAAKRPTPTNGCAESMDDGTQNDEFQRQSTPLQLSHHETSCVANTRDESAALHDDVEMDQTRAHDDESTTDDEDDLDAMPAKPRASQSPSDGPSKQVQMPPSPFTRKLGTIGGRSPLQSASPAKEQIPDEKPQSPKPRSKLGTIGGKVKAPAHKTTPAHTGKHEASTPPPSKPAKMGVIRTKKVQSSKAAAAQVEEPRAVDAMPELSPRQARTPVKEPSPAPRETSEERADRKRNQLKREMEEKAKAPAKKRRKF